MSSSEAVGNTGWSGVSQQMERSWFFKLCSYAPVWLIWYIIGVLCAFRFPFYLLKGIPARLLAFTMVAGFTALAFLGVKFRDSEILREPPADFRSKYVVLLITSAITVTVSITYKLSELSVIGFTCLAVALLSLTMIAHPVNDGGLFQFFVWMPFQVAVGHYKKNVNIYYYLTFFMALICLACQVYFSQHFDETYARQQYEEELRRTQQANQEDMLRQLRGHR